MPRIVPIGLLDDDQKKFLLQIDENPNQSFWINGFPGSGKTVLLYYAVKKINDSYPNHKIAFTTFTHTLLNLFESITNEINVEGLKNCTIYQFIKNAITQDVSICDEIQDYSYHMIVELKKLSHRLILAGDANQSIYSRDPHFNDIIPPCEESKKYLRITDVNLSINHRLPRKIILALNFIMNSNKIWQGADAKKEGNLLFYESDSIAKEVSFIFKDAKEKAERSGLNVVILFSRKKDMKLFANEVLSNHGINKFFGENFNSFNDYLEQKNVKIHFVVNQVGNLKQAESEKKVVLMTMHGAKGLDFDAVYLPLFNFDYEIYPHNPDKIETLLMVAMTRTKSDLIFSYNKIPHELLARIINKGICQQMTENSVDSDSIMFPSIDF
ncbi:MAG: 3'-5' exonuclease [Saprospiraceae bacterium]